jgi:4-hydroxy-tetrahydrodipicolinate synthase
MAVTSLFQGCGTALVTPFRNDLALDEQALRKLVRRQVNGGVNFLVPCGTTGENPTLSHEEHLRVVDITMEEAAGRVPVLAGCGGYNTAETIELARELEALRVSGLLSVAPYYNRPTQEGLYQHYSTIAEAVALPIMLYNVPARTACNIEPTTVRRLAQIENIVGVKEASGNISQIGAICAHAPSGFTVISGDDAMTLPAAALGARGVISVVANEMPAEMTLLTQLCLTGKFEEALVVHRKLLPLMDVNFAETNPIPVKAALAAMGLIEPIWRLPMCPPRAETMEKIRGVLESLGLVNNKHAARVN